MRKGKLWKFKINLQKVSYHIVYIHVLNVEK